MARMRISLFRATLVWLSFCSSLLASGQLLDPLEVQALREVKQELTDPLGRLKNWKKSSRACNWTGVHCTNASDPLDGYIHVYELRLLNMNLSGQMSPALGQFTHMGILNFMWNSISGSIPKEVGKMTALKFLLLSGNEISGPLPDELGNLPNINKFQLDLNYLSGPIPKTFANLSSVVHFHMNNNSFSGQIPPELAKLPKLAHFLLDNNNLSGYLPPELSQMPMMKIFQVNNNNFSGTTIPESYTNMSQLIKLTVRNCNLQGIIPDFSGVTGLRYLDVSHNQLTGTIPTNKLSDNVTTIDFSHNMLIGSIPASLSTLSKLQRLSLNDNSLNGTIPSTFWMHIVFVSDTVLLLDFRNNYISNITGTLMPPPNVTIQLKGNSVCGNANELGIEKFCGPIDDQAIVEVSGNSTTGTPPYLDCKSQSCPSSEAFEYITGSPIPCFCAAPIGVGMRLRSPSLSDFRPYMGDFRRYITGNLGVNLYQLSVAKFIWQEGPRVRLELKLFPDTSIGDTFNSSELERVLTYFARFSFPSSEIFGPYDLLNFTLIGPYRNVIVQPSKSGMSNGAVAGIVLGTISCAVTLLLVIAFVYAKTHPKQKQKSLKRQPTGKTSCKIDGVKAFSFMELGQATGGFTPGSEVGQGGYGRVYKGILADGTVVAVKRAQQGSLQGEREFYTEIELLSRVHHRNLVSLVGYCDEEGEQMLVYEFMPNGSLQSALSGNNKFGKPLDFATRMQIALDSAKGVHYLHIDADPPIIHRDIKANNILLDSKFTAKVSDFGISKLAPVSENKGVTPYVSTAVKGTPGYVDPEYFLTRKLTEKSDVYSLGVVFLELLTGMPPIANDKNIVREVVAACQSGKILAVIDRDMGLYTPEIAKKFMMLALKCCHDETKARPSMLEVVRELENLCSSLPKSETNHSNVSNASSSGISGSFGPSPQQLYYERNAQQNNNYASSSTNYVGSNLVSGVFPDIKPR